MANAEELITEKHVGANEFSICCATSVQKNSFQNIIFVKKQIIVSQKKIQKLMQNLPT